MTTINTSSLVAQSSAYSLSIKGQDASTDSTATTDTDKTSVDLSKVRSTEGSGAAQASGSSPTEQMIEQLKKQIEQTRKQLEQQKAQLAAVQNSKIDEQAKAQQVAALQAQMASTSASLQTLEGSLMQLLTDSIKGSHINTTA